MNTDWKPVGYTLVSDDDIVVGMFKLQYPGLRGDLKIHPRGKDGFRKLEFKSS